MEREDAAGHRGQEEREAETEGERGGASPQRGVAYMQMRHEGVWHPRGSSTKISYTITYFMLSVQSFAVIVCEFE